MTDKLQVVAFEGGELTAIDSGIVPGEAVLALPLSRLIVKMVRVPAGEDPEAFSAPVLSALSPFPDEPLAVSCETVRENEQGEVVIAAALPESSADDIADALDAAKISVTRVDALVFGQLRSLWSRINDSRTDVRRLVLIKEREAISLIVLDDDQPSAIRAITDITSLRREIMLSLLEAEDFGGAKKLSEIVAVGEIDTAGLDSFAPVRAVEIGGESLSEALSGVAERTGDPSSLNVLPASWREVLEETRFKAKLKKSLAFAGGIWALVMLTLFGVPVVYGFLTDHQRTLRREHSRQYNTVLSTKEKVELVRKYSDHSRGALEVMLRVSGCLPMPEDANTSCIELSSWNFKREDGVKFSGEADSAALVYQFKNSLIESGMFARVELQGPSAGRGGRQRFDIECLFEAEEDEP